MKHTWLSPSEGKLKPLHQDDQTNIMFATELKCPDVFSEDGITYTSTRHIFTENEINRACVRFFAETGEKLREKIKLGYVGVTTFVNNQGTMVTRYLVNMKTPAGVQTMLFSAREFQRSTERFALLCPEKVTWKDAICRLFKKKK